MGKLACKLCIGAAVIALILQIIANFTPLLHIQMISLAGFFVSRPLVQCHVYWNTMQVRVTVFGVRETIGAGNQVVRGANGRAAYKARKEGEKEAKRLKAEEEKDATYEQLLKTDAKKAEEFQKSRQTVTTMEKEYYAKFKKQLNKRWCDSSQTTECYDIPLRELASLFGNQGAQMLSAWIPGFPGSHNAAPALYWGGLAVMLTSVFACISLALGGGYLYYYCEVKASKTARKGAMVAMTAAPCLCLLAILAISAMTVFCTPRTGNPFMLIIGSQSGAYWHVGAFFILFNMLFMGMCLCFSRFWRMRRAERVRKQHKDEEEEEEFMRLMGIDRSGLDQESDDESSDEEESEEEEDDAEQPRSSRLPVRPPTIVPSAPVMNTTYTTMPVGQTYTTYSTQAAPVTTQRIVIDPNQVGTQRIYI
jgi:hypothetical protein